MYDINVKKTEAVVAGRKIVITKKVCETFRVPLFFSQCSIFNFNSTKTKQNTWNDCLIEAKAKCSRQTVGVTRERDKETESACGSIWRTKSRDDFYFLINVKSSLFF